MADYLDAIERAELQALRRLDAGADETLLELDRILSSDSFARAQQRCRNFLCFVVAKMLLGKADQIKETTVAIAVFGESSDFDPLESSKVRTAAAALRERLTTYYIVDGRFDPVLIQIPEGTYIPAIENRRVTVLVDFLDNWHPRDDQRHLCVAITDHIVYQLNEAPCVRAMRSEGTAAGTSGRRFRVRGSMEIFADLLKVNVSLSDVTAGRIVCSHIIEGQRDDVLRVASKAAVYLLNALTAPSAPMEAARVVHRQRLR